MMAMMNYFNLIPWTISLISLIIAGLSLSHTKGKDKIKTVKEDDLKFEGIKEGVLKANMKLDQVCATTNETRSDIKSLNNDLKEIDTRVVVLERDIKTAFNQISEIKERVDSYEH